MQISKMNGLDLFSLPWRAVYGNLWSGILCRIKYSSFVVNVGKKTQIITFVSIYTGRLVPWLVFLSG